MARKTPQDKRAGSRAAKKVAKARKSGTASRPGAGKAAKKATKKATKKAARKAAKKTVGKTVAPATKKARAEKAARRAAAKKAVARKTAAKKTGAKPLGRTPAKTGAGEQPQPSARRTAPRISAGRRATPRKTTSREALVSKTVRKKAAPAQAGGRARKLAGKTAAKGGGKRPTQQRAAGKTSAAPGEAQTVAASVRVPSQATGKTARSRIVARASKKLAPPVLRDGARRRVEKPTAPRPQKAASPARKPPFRAHALGVRDEHATDRPRIEALLTQAFGRPEEARIVQQLRDAGDLLCALVAEYEGDIIGYIGFSRVEAAIDGRSVKATALAPLAVAPPRQGRGVGSVLVSAGLEAVRTAGFDAVFVVGDRAYYERFGFSAEAAAPYKSPWKQALLALELEPLALSGAAGDLVHPLALRPGGGGA